MPDAAIQTIQLVGEPPGLTEALVQYAAGDVWVPGSVFDHWRTASSHLSEIRFDGLPLSLRQQVKVYFLLSLVTGELALATVFGDYGPRLRHLGPFVTLEYPDVESFADVDLDQFRADYRKYLANKKLKRADRYTTIIRHLHQFAAALPTELWKRAQEDGLLVHHTVDSYRLILELWRAYVSRWGKPETMVDLGAAKTSPTHVSGPWAQSVWDITDPMFQPWRMDAHGPVSPIHFDGFSPELRKEIQSFYRASLVQETATLAKVFFWGRTHVQLTKFFAYRYPNLSSLTVAPDGLVSAYQDFLRIQRLAYSTRSSYVGLLVECIKYLLGDDRWEWQERVNEQKTVRPLPVVRENQASDTDGDGDPWTQDKWDVKAEPFSQWLRTKHSILVLHFGMLPRQLRNDLQQFYKESLQNGTLTWTTLGAYASAHTALAAFWKATYNPAQKLADVALLDLEQAFSGYLRAKGLAEGSIAPYLRVVRQPWKFHRSRIADPGSPLLPMPNGYQQRQQEIIDSLDGDWVADTWDPADARFDASREPGVEVRDQILATSRQGCGRKFSFSTKLASRKICGDSVRSSTPEQRTTRSDSF